MNTKHEITTSWSFNEEHIYLDNDTLDERMIDIYFMDDDLRKIDKSKKIEVLISLLTTLKE